ncbi:hypothetical protein DXG03_002104 [Asterophora parasitica]|uniref:Uncharacterized protein n=1 Tax=Asterophora parasitica TaxID=117018 RepID=A0A9P7G4N7_9AGAR|nr:hypothetical protein DXG03_002104 [Asterophora parasitica]
MAFDAGGGTGGGWPAMTLGGGCVLRIAPIMKKREPIPIAEMNKESLRPRVSTPKRMNMVRVD